MIARPDIDLEKEAMEFGIGQPVRREEDPRFLTGRGQYTDDFNPPNLAHAAVVRSHVARARIRRIDTDAAKAVPGVLAAFTAEDMSGLGPMPILVPTLRQLERPDGSPMPIPERHALARDYVAHLGEGLALVVAETREAAEDAAELVELHLEELPPVVTTAQALTDGAPAVWQAVPDNVAFRVRLGDKAAVQQALDQAEHVVRAEIPVSRIAVNPMEPRGAIGDHDPASGSYTLISGHQNPHDLRDFLADHVLKIGRERLRVISPDMGGGFGMRADTSPEFALVLFAAERLGRPVKWIADRSETFLADPHGRDMILDVRLGLDQDGRFTGLRVDCVAALGAYLTFFSPLPTFGNLPGVAGPYTTPVIYGEVRGVFTNTTPIAPYRGAGRPEASLAIEHVIDVASREIGIDRVELRRRNLIPADRMPYQTGLTFKYDCGDFGRVFERALEVADHAGFASRRAQAEAEGRLLGLGLASTVEQSAGLFDEAAELTFEPDGTVTLGIGTHSHGQGHETVFKQVLAERLGISFEKIRFVQGDTTKVAYGHGTGGSRASGLGSGALVRAAEAVIEKGKEIAAHLFEASAVDVRFADGRFTIAGTDRSLSLDEVARAALEREDLPEELCGGLAGAGRFKHESGPTFPNGCHVCEVEVDPETGMLRLTRYHAVGDYGTVLNPLLLEGQVHGGIVQGLGQILLEDLDYDPRTGQLRTGSFMDYAMPRAAQVPPIRFESAPVPTEKNPLGVKGVGESGTVASMPCVMNAIIDALAPFGVRTLSMPATPEKVWRALSGVDR
jgi:aerobic carbon-monoxide dehydrogenase large subunit